MGTRYGFSMVALAFSASPAKAEAGGECHATESAERDLVSKKTETGLESGSVAKEYSLGLAEDQFSAHGAALNFLELQHPESDALTSASTLIHTQRRTHRQL